VYQCQRLNNPCTGLTKLEDTEEDSLP
jgi:hypothetical protein